MISPLGRFSQSFRDWLVVWNMNVMTFHILGMSIPQLTFTPWFFRGVGIKYITNQMPWDFTTIKSHETRRVSSQVSLALGTPSPLPVRCPMRGTAGRASWSWARPVWSGDAAMACHGDARKMGTSPPKMEFDPAKCWILYHKWWEITIKNDG